MQLTTSIPLDCNLDGRCSRDEVTLTSTPQQTIEYVFNDFPLPIDALDYQQIYPECPLTESFTELNQNGYNLAGTYITDYDPETCAFTVYTNEPQLEDATIPMQITISPLYNFAGSDQCLFDIYISASCGAIVPDPINFTQTFFEIYLWAPEPIDFDALYADEACAITEFVIVPLQPNTPPFVQVEMVNDTPMVVVEPVTPEAVGVYAFEV